MDFNIPPFLIMFLAVIACGVWLGLTLRSQGSKNAEREPLEDEEGARGSADER